MKKLTLASIIMLSSVLFYSQDKFGKIKIWSKNEESGLYEKTGKEKTVFSELYYNEDDQLVVLIINKQASAFDIYDISIVHEGTEKEYVKVKCMDFDKSEYIMRLYTDTGIVDLIKGKTLIELIPKI